MLPTCFLDAVKMKCFQVLLVGMIYVFILPPCHTNDARAAINIGVSHATLEGLKENFKVLIFH